jgi:hypothetical protein
VLGEVSIFSINGANMLGVRLAIAVLVDATIVRTLIVPATVKLMGERTGGHPPRCGASTSDSGCTKHHHRPRHITPMRRSLSARPSKPSSATQAERVETGAGSRRP